MTAKTTGKPSPSDTAREDAEQPADTGSVAADSEQEARDTGVEDAGQEVAAEEAVPEEAVSEDAESEDTEPKDTESKDAKPEDTKPKDTESEDAVSEKAVPAAGGRMRRPNLPTGTSRRLAVAALALVFATAVVTAVIQWRESDRLATRDQTEQQVRDRSAEFGRALLAYNHTDLPGARARIRGLTSADFGRTYETAFDGLAEVITKYRANATATVRDTYLNAFDGQNAKTLVVLDSEVRSTMGVRRVLGTKLLLELVLERGAWRVDGLTTLPADDETLTKPDGTVEKPQQNGVVAPSPQPSP
ncbi:hypothetical protein DPM19_02115 [Actinomadura craniellae]|uniref:Mce-associated membrane protein n=1 Tax=Actinomadura craniellae TaxID=2231787 RepID=A0A365HD87_9ACTN|nr:hypothetical protein [Actinomadura craniellae]RAY16982.1 hypothetical protein DPM19_02115 [Actinomadura craniellae]